MALQVRELRRDDRAEVAAWIDVVMAAVQVSRPTHRPRGLDATMAELATPQPGFEDHHLVGLVDGAIVTAADWYLFSGEEADKAMIGVYTHPTHRGRGYGQAVADAAQARIDRPTLIAEVDYREQWDAERDGRFAAARGFRATSFYTAGELAWPADPGRLDGLGEVADGYEVARSRARSAR